MDRTAALGASATSGGLLGGLSQACFDSCLGVVCFFDGGGGGGRLLRGHCQKTTKHCLCRPVRAADEQAAAAQERHRGGIASWTARRHWELLHRLGACLRTARACFDSCFEDCLFFFAGGGRGRLLGGYCQKTTRHCLGRPVVAAKEQAVAAWQRHRGGIASSTARRLWEILPSHPDTDY